MSLKAIMNFTLSAVATAGLFGCGKSADQTAPSGDASTTTAASHEGHSHDGWWCSEHGVPEAECALCSAEIAAEFKAKGDWCKEHDRPESQCFICHPEKEAEFAAQYEAKYGEAPPKRSAEDAEHGDHDHEHGEKT